MVSLLHHSISIHNPPSTRHHLRPRATSRPSNPKPLLSATHKLPSPFHIHRPRAATLSITCSNQNQPQRPERTLFPGGYKRPEIKIPNIVLELNPEEVMSDQKSVIEVVDKAVSRYVGVVVLNCGKDGNGRVLYDAGCLLKSIIRDRAYLLINERVDIATAVNASGVVVSDQGLPAIVARNTIMDSKSDSVFLPLIGRKVQALNTTMNASSFEGADFVIYDKNKEENIADSIISQVKIPIFVTVDSINEDALFNEMSCLLQSGASGLVVSLEGLKLLGNDALNKIYSLQALNNGLEVDKFNGFPSEKQLTGFLNLKERELEMIETERSLLLEAIDVIQRASPLMEEISLLSDAVSHLSEPFLLVIVVIVR